MLKIEDTTPEASLPNWQRVQDLLQLSPKASSKLLPSEKAKNDKLLVTHKTVYVRLTFANFHLSILKQANNDSVKRAVFEDTVINIVSSLQALAHLLNELYEFGIKDASVVIDHLQYNNEAERKKASKRCLRCKLRDHNEDIAYLLDGV